MFFRDDLLPFAGHHHPKLLVFECCLVDHVILIDFVECGVTIQLDLLLVIVELDDQSHRQDGYLLVALLELVSWVPHMVTWFRSATCFVLVVVLANQDLSTDPQGSVLVYFLEKVESVVLSLEVDYPCRHLVSLELLDHLEVEVVMEAIQNLLHSVSVSELLDVVVCFSNYHLLIHSGYKIPQ